MTNLKELRKGENGKGLLIERDAGFIDPLREDNVESLESLQKIGSTDAMEIKEPLIMTCILQKFGIKNANGRIYPEDILKREWETYMEKIKNKSAYGECNHPTESTIDLSRIGINIVDGWWEKSTLLGKVEIIMSPGFVKHGIISCQGDIIANLLRKGLRIGVSSRGLGSVKQVMGKTVVQDDFELVCWDAVADPSTPGAYIFYDEDKPEFFVETVDKSITLKENLDLFIKNTNKTIL